MQNDAAQYLEFIEFDERRRERFLRRWLGLGFVFIALGLGSLSQGTEPFIVGLAGFFLFSCAVLLKRSGDLEATQREERLLRMLEVDLDLLESDLGRQQLIFAAETGKFTELQVKKSNAVVRGQDEKGFTGGATIASLGRDIARRDAKESEGVYEGMEGDLRRSEHLVSEANARYESVANEQWQASEKADADLIEAGVERLGDLVRTDWFDKNAKVGAVDELMGQGQKE
jgi:hypothetical protein